MPRGDLIEGNVDCVGALAIMQPIISVLRLGDSNSPSASKVHYMMYVAKTKLLDLEFPWMDKEEQTEVIDTIIDIHHSRWDYMFNDILATGHLLDPEYWDMEERLQDAEIMDAFTRMVDRTFPHPVQPLLPSGASDEDIVKHLSLIHI